MKNSINSVKGYFIILVMTFSIGFLGCEEGASPYDLNLFSLEDDKQLGADIVAQIDANPQEYPPYNNIQAQQYLQNMVNEIIKSPDVKYAGTFNYNVKIINKGDVVNAFALPGGYVYVYTGLLKFIDNEATLASVLAHEIAHAERRHSTKRLTKHYGVQFLLGLLLGQNPSAIEEISANLLTGLGFLYNSREDEYEADEYAFKYLRSTIWYPAAMTYFFDAVKRDEKEGFLKELLSTHPLPQQRIDAVNALIKKYNIPTPTESNLFSQRYSQFKNTIP